MVLKTMVPELNPMFRFQWEQAQNCYVLLFPEGMVKLNGSAGEIIKLVNGEHSVEKIIEILMAKFPEAGDLTEDIHSLISSAIDKKWIYDEK
jgi:pyrroloquinoline quinone biosynthesis protein D